MLDRSAALHPEWLQPGDCVVLNAATSSVGQCLLQLCKLLRLRAVAVVRSHGEAAFDKTAAWLRGLGACEVLRDEGSLRVSSGSGWAAAREHRLQAVAFACELAVGV